jgi:hypothetical protein
MRNDDNHKGPKPFSVCFIIGLLIDIPELETQENDIEAAEHDINSDIVALLNIRVRFCGIGSSPDVKPQSLQDLFSQQHNRKRRKELKLTLCTAKANISHGESAKDREVNLAHRFDIRDQGTGVALAS